MSLEKEDLRTKHDPDIMNKLRDISAYYGMEITRQAAILFEKAVVGEWHIVNLGLERIKRNERMRDIVVGEGNDRDNLVKYPIQISDKEKA
ncbi:hypothetical protein F4V57_14230 [Acinetobacter qingfengensis]|uniref:Uncharacterized protein n=1 Tax=Acinetobacter qingfengensis TaxID=1262585 RepID=A0A1E7QYS7_9GAMM|nr:hypothetical protein [Acinetobacter qingfengensis]KAA8731007.1 hypothetical protein F4V57_14230 [Acinetobacter qingfengensis]OEY92214.1 hypothetical protein BJI46_05535 [Acinetobacter qingfengensis]